MMRKWLLALGLFVLAGPVFAGEPAWLTELRVLPDGQLVHVELKWAPEEEVTGLAYDVEGRMPTPGEVAAFASGGMRMLRWTAPLERKTLDLYSLVLSPYDGIVWGVCDDKADCEKHVNTACDEMGFGYCLKGAVTIEAATKDKEGSCSGNCCGPGSVMVSCARSSPDSAVNAPGG